MELEQWYTNIWSCTSTVHGQHYILKIFSMRLEPIFAVKALPVI